ncbi:MAG: alanine racemase, partial [Azonexus sp.]|nr:alanine racemase [Azonexus sp.]
MSTSRPLRVRITPAAIRANYHLVKRLTPNARAWAVVKADAYGHGQWRAVAALRDDADGFALLECENAVALREQGVTQPILLLEGIFSPTDAAAVFSHRLTTVVHCAEQLEWLLAVRRDDQPLDLYLKLNSGMNRLGFTAESLPRARELLARLPQARITLMTHFAEADGERGIDWQLARFWEMAGETQTLAGAGERALCRAAAAARSSLSPRGRGKEGEGGGSGIWGPSPSPQPL